MRSIEIRTSQNVVIDYELATLRERFLSTLIDSGIILFAYYFLYAFIISQILPFMVYEDEGWYRVMTFIPIMMFLMYYLLLETFMGGQTIGKKAMGIKVVRLDGEEVKLSDYLARTLFMLADYLLSAGVLGAILIGSSKNRQRLGDMTAHTTVIKLSPGLSFKLEDILKINNIENYEPQYPEVRSLSEADMLLLKHSLNRYRNHPNAAHRKVIIALYEKMCEVLDVQGDPKDKIGFLKTLLRDYIVLTR